MIEYYRNQPGALDNLRAPIFENKVVAYILEIAKVTDRPVALADLLKDEDEEEDGGEDAAPAEGEKTETEPKKRATRKKQS